MRGLRALCAIGLLCFQAGSPGGTGKRHMVESRAERARLRDRSPGRHPVLRRLSLCGERTVHLVCSAGPLQSDGSYQGTLQSYGNGQSLTGTYQAPVTTNANAGNITIQFSDTTHGTLTWPAGRRRSSASCSVRERPFSTPRRHVVERGGSGRGFLIEIQDGTLFMGGYMYDGAGNPVWYSTAGPMASSTLYQGRWTSTAGARL